MSVSCIFFWDKIIFLGCKNTLPTRSRFYIHPYPQALLLEAALNPLTSQFVLILGCCAKTGVRPCTWLCWTSWGLHRATSLAFQGPSGCHCFPQVCSAPPLSVSFAVPSAKLLRMHYIPLSVLLTKALSSTCPHRVPLQEGHSSKRIHLDTKPFTAALWKQPLTQLPTHVKIYLLNAYLVNLERCISCKFTNIVREGTMSKPCRSKNRLDQLPLPTSAVTQL